MCNNNCYNGCASNRYYGGDCENYETYEEVNTNCGCNRSCGCNHSCGCNYSDEYGCAAFHQAARINNRILARRACEDRAAAHYLRNLQSCRRCW